MSLKLCKKCETLKNVEHFHNDKNRADGRYPNCKECHGKYIRDRYKNKEGVRENHLNKHKEKLKYDENYSSKMKLNSKKFYNSLNGRAKTLFANAFKSSKNKKIEFSLTLEHIIKGIETSVCPVTGIEFQLNDSYMKNSGRKKNPYSPSLDRINALKGYTNENTRIVIWQYNMMKGELTDNEIKIICEKVCNHVKS